MLLTQKTNLLLGVFFLLFWGVAAPALAQGETDNWLFGQGASLEFQNGQPVSFRNSAMLTAQEGCAAISDKGGNLLFYSDGVTIWNRLHQPMQNGINLAGNLSSTQSALIVPMPGSDSLYYLFTTDAQQNGQQNGLRYNLIDITADNGNGAVLAGAKNQLLYGAPPHILSEKITGVHHVNNQEIWLITHRFADNATHEFIAFKITAAGIQTTPVLSQVPTGFAIPYATGYLKASPDGKYLAAAFGQAGVQLFSFNNQTGMVSNKITLLPPDGKSYYGVEFSQRTTKLYVTEPDRLIQFDLNNTSAGAIIGSAVAMGPTATAGYGALQLAANRKIYAVLVGRGALQEIAQPDLRGQAAQLQPGPVLAPGTNSLNGLPNFMQSYLAPPRFSFGATCAGQPAAFSIPDQSGIDSVRWDFGDGGTSTLLQPTHLYQSGGFFRVLLTIFRGSEAAVFTRLVTVQNTPLIDIGPDQEICAGREITLRNHFPVSSFNESYLWSTGETSPSIKINKAGIYWLQLTNDNCTIRDSVTLTVLPEPIVRFNIPSPLCGNAPVTLNAFNEGATYKWEPGGSTSPAITVSRSGTYAVTVNLNGCEKRVMANLTFNNDLNLDFGPDIVRCEGEVVHLSALKTKPTQYRWNDNSTEPILKVTESGTYWVQLSRGGCVVSDTVNVRFKPCLPVIIPNIITPNADSRNDTFKPLNLPDGPWNLSIFDRWGSRIFQADNYQSNWPEKPVSDGSYFYLLENPETKQQHKGWLEITR